MSKGISRFIGTFALMSCAYFIPFNKILGSWFGHFSWSSIAAPVSAYHFGLLSLLSIVAAKGVFALQTFSFFYVCKRLPLIISSWAFRSHSWIAEVAIPALCMMLFMVHPIGSQVFYYSFYWLIPVAFYFIPRSIYTRSLSATFVAHAIGSVVWLYFRGLDVSVWNALMPVVAFERLLMASGMVGLHFVIQGAKQVYRYGITELKAVRKNS